MTCGDYEHFMFSAEFGLEVIDTGVPSRSGLEDVKPFPLHYRMDRSGYRLEVKMDESAYGPAAAITATSDSKAIPVRMLTTTKLPNTDQYCFSYREVESQLLVSWVGGDGCEAIRAFQVAIHHPNGDVQDIEVLSFDIVKNGRYCVEDGP